MCERMKRIELFEEGFFLSFVIDGGKAFAVKAPMNSPCIGNYDLIPLPPVSGGEENFVFDGYEDTGNQTGRAVTLSFLRQSDGMSAKVIFQFCKGHREMNVSTAFQCFCDTLPPHTLRFSELFENCLEGVEHSSSGEGSELFSLIHDLNEKEV